ncbi:uncharacterized protein LOC142031755 [Buteo buteo]|uniref:uncharacterized protein LOC142031755 n=1 Tax=Buteo buteo TaxID=30397 RepID=UPI003EBBF883
MRTGPPSSSSGPLAPALPLSGSSQARAKATDSPIYQSWGTLPLTRVAEKLPGANLLLLKRLLALLQHIGHNASSSRMTASNLAICLGPNLLSPPHEDLLPLEAMLAVTEKVNVLVEFMIDNCRELFGEQTTDLSCSAAEESSAAPTESCGELHLEEQSVPAVTADTKHQTEASLHAPPSLLGVLREAGGAMVVESERGEALPPTTPESAAEPLVRPEELANLSEERRFAGSPQDKEKKKNRKRKQAWGEESDRHAEKRRRKRENVFGDGLVKRCRKVQQLLPSEEGSAELSRDVPGPAEGELLLGQHPDRFALGGAPPLCRAPPSRAENTEAEPKPNGTELSRAEPSGAKHSEAEPSRMEPN